MAFSLAPSAALEGFRLEAYDTIGSTNVLALERARSGGAGKLWIVSKRQEQGRGRRGRPWATPEGNLAATLLLVGRWEPRLAATLGFVAGLALSDALNAVAPSARLSIGVDGADDGVAKSRFELKWPNDVLVQGGKIAGILLESALLPDDRFAVAIGIGVNVAAYPEDTPYPATSLRALGEASDAETLFLALSEAWMENVARWGEGRGLAAVRQRWLARAAGLGGEVAVRVDGDVVRGIFETIDEDCRFVIRSREGAAVRIAAGDVHFGAVASAPVG
jgi:BirA family biotin operon repressor/biotin-[acetyl-CoA-carboxylase] ligase